MTRSHFQALADCAAEIVSNLDNPTQWNTEMIIREIAAVCKLSNPNFDSQRFRAWVDAKVEKNLAITS